MFAKRLETSQFEINKIVPMKISNPDSVEVKACAYSKIGSTIF